MEASNEKKFYAWRSNILSKNLSVLLFFLGDAGLSCTNYDFVSVMPIFVRLNIIKFNMIKIHHFHSILILVCLP